MFRTTCLVATATIASAVKLTTASFAPETCDDLRDGKDAWMSKCMPAGTTKLTPEC